MVFQGLPRAIIILSDEFQGISTTSYSRSEMSNQPYIRNSVKGFTGGKMNAEGIKSLCIHYPVICLSFLHDS